MTATATQAAAIKKSLINILGAGDERKPLNDLFGDNQLLVAEDAFGDVRLVLFIDDMNIHDFNKSPCGRFQVDPQEAYGLSPEQVHCFKQLEKLMDKAVQNGLNTICLAIQDELGIEAGDYAGIHFSGGPELNKLREVVGNYLLAELRQVD
jgi:hypothetical protein